MITFEMGEPCADCKHWDNKIGCKEGRYNSYSLQVFGYCGFASPIRETENEFYNIVKLNK